MARSVRRHTVTASLIYQRDISNWLELLGGDSLLARLSLDDLGKAWLPAEARADFVSAISQIAQLLIPL